MEPSTSHPVGWCQEGQRDGANKVGGGAQALELNGLSWGTGAFWDRMVIEAAPGTCVLEAGEGHLRLGRLALCGRPAPSAAA